MKKIDEAKDLTCYLSEIFPRPFINVCKSFFPP